MSDQQLDFLTELVDVAKHQSDTLNESARELAATLETQIPRIVFDHDEIAADILASTLDAIGDDPAAWARQLNGVVRTRIGAVAKVDQFQVVPGLPKTRSGKVMRRILRKVAERDISRLGDTSTLADPSVVEAIIAGAGLKK